MFAQRSTRLLVRLSRGLVTCATSHSPIAQRVRRPATEVSIDSCRRLNAFSAQARKMAASKEWHEAYPNPRNQSPDAISRQALLERLRKGQKPGVDFLLVDLRKADHQVRTNPIAPYTPSLL